MTSHPRKRRWWKTALRATLFLFVLALTLVVLAAATLSFLGRRDWARVKEELAARGEPLSLAALQPPPIPDAQNFFADPIWMELADLVDVETTYGDQKISTKQVRLPKGERQLDVLSRPLMPAERKTLADAFPEFSGPADLSMIRLVGEAYEVAKPADPPVRRQAAKFILAATASSEPVLTRLSQLAQRPGSWFPVDYLENGFVDERTNYMTGYAQFLRMRVWAELESGDGAAAFRDAMIALRLQEALANEPLLISLMVRMATASIALEAVEEGLRSRLWTDAELQELEQRLAGTNFPAGIALALRGERGLGNQFFEELHRKDKNAPSPAQKMWSGPGPSVYLGIFGAGEQARRNAILQNWIDVSDATPREGLNARTFAIFQRDVQSLKENFWNRLRYRPNSFVIPNLQGITNQSAQLQDQIQQIRTACALERYRLRNGRYPEELSALVPEFLTALPTDISTLRPLRYRREGSGFVLWTPGWNEKDEGGSGDDLVWKKQVL